MIEKRQNRTFIKLLIVITAFVVMCFGYSKVQAFNNNSYMFVNSSDYDEASNTITYTWGTSSTTNPQPSHNPMFKMDGGNSDSLYPFIVVNGRVLEPSNGTRYDSSVDLKNLINSNEFPNSEDSTGSPLPIGFYYVPSTGINNGNFCENSGPGPLDGDGYWSPEPTGITSLTFSDIPEGSYTATMCVYIQDRNGCFYGDEDDSKLSCGGTFTFAKTTSCTPNWQCDIPLNGNESDGCGNSRANSRCDALLTCDVNDYPSNQFNACYYDGVSDPDDNDPILSKRYEGSASGLNNRWGYGEVNNSGETDTVSAVYRGTFNFAQNANYEFEVGADDGVKLYIDGLLILDEWKLQSYTIYRPSQYMTVGNHDIKLVWYENEGSADVTLRWDLVTGPTVDLKVNGSDQASINEGGNVELSWVTGDSPSYCIASSFDDNRWSGWKSTGNNSQSLGVLNTAGRYEYSLTCYKRIGFWWYSATDIAVLDVVPDRIDGQCNTSAEGLYQSTETEYRLPLCAAGTAVDVLPFPARGSVVDGAWTCQGSGPDHVDDVCNVETEAIVDVDDCDGVSCGTKYLDINFSVPLVQCM